jgi:N-acetylneuraminic acid mutarotase
MTGQSGRFDPAGAGIVSARAALPNGLTLQGASAGTLDETIYLAGGITDMTNTLNEQVLAYAPATNTWSAAALPALPASRVDMASAVVGNRWFLFGGLGREALSAEGPFQPESAVSIFQASPAPAWAAGAPMPTARSGAGTVVVAGEIWVIGGAGAAGEPLAAVEVYNPATGQWRIHSPLKQARAFPAVGLLNGQIVVAGGMDGFEPRLGLPLDSVEVLTP